MPHDPSDPGLDPLGLGPRDRESSNTGSVEDTRDDAVAADPNTTGEPERRVDDAADGARPRRDAPSPSRPADPDVRSPDEP